MFGLKALFGLLEVGVLILVGGRLQVVVHGVGGAGCGCGYYKRGGEKETVQRRGFFSLSTLLYNTQKSPKTVIRVSASLG